MAYQLYSYGQSYEPVKLQFLAMACVMQGQQEAILNRSFDQFDCEKNRYLGS